MAKRPPAAPAWAPGRPGVGFIGCDLPPSVSVQAKMFENKLDTSLLIDVGKSMKPKKIAAHLYKALKILEK